MKVKDEEEGDFVPLTLWTKGKERIGADHRQKSRPADGGDFLLESRPGIKTVFAVRLKKF